MRPLFRAIMLDKETTMANLVNKRAKDAAMSGRLPPSPATHKVKSAERPYHNNLGTNHRKMIETGAKALRQNKKVASDE